MLWRICAKSIEGTSHITKGVPCQDSSKAIRVITSQGLFIILLASDGCGSSKYSDIGSELVIKEVSSCLTYWIRRSEYLPNLADLIVFSFGHANQMLYKKATELSVSIRDLASTCLCTVIGPTSFAVAQIGDGVIVRRMNGVTGCVFWSNQEYTNVTNTLIDKDWIYKTQVINSLSQEGLAGDWFMATDGIQDIACDIKNKIPHPGFVSVLLDKIIRTEEIDEKRIEASLDQFLRSSRVSSVVNDDKTIVLACRQ